MTLHFITKEIWETLLGPKFFFTFVICLILVLTSVYSGYRLYEAEQQWYVNAKSQNVERLENLGSYGSLRNQGTKAQREPTRMSIFVKGVDSAIGRSAMVNNDPNTVLRDSRYGLNPIFAVFGELDLAFIVKIILSLFALLFSYNAISGERELGTLKQILSNRVSRVQIIIGKAIGGVVVLLLTLLIPLIISLLMLMIAFDVNFTAEEWTRIGLMVLVFALYLTTFFMLGMFMSALTRQSAVSFLLCLFVWVLSIAVMPKLAVEIASQVSPAPSIDEVEAKRTVLRRSYYQDFETRWETELNRIYNEGDPTREAVRELRGRIEKESRDLIADEEKKLLNDYRLKQVKLLKTSRNIARISPTSCATFSLNRIGLTDAGLRERFLDDLGRYRNDFDKFAEAKIKANPDLASSGVSTSISVDSDDDGENRQVSISVRTPSRAIEVNGLPDFYFNLESFTETSSAIIPDMAVLLVEILLFFSGAFIAFLRYDVR